MAKAKPLAKDFIGRDIEIGKIVSFAAGSCNQASFMSVGAVVYSQGNTVKFISFREGVMEYVSGKTSVKPNLSIYWGDSGKAERMLLISPDSLPPEYELARQFVEEELKKGNINNL